jgi:hypothetical protein
MLGSIFAAWMAGTSPAMTAVGIFGNWRKATFAKRRRGGLPARGQAA